MIPTRIVKLPGCRRAEVTVTDAPYDNAAVARSFYRRALKIVLD
jgi:hypothetical protein